jgi:site-specific DNA-methyltransferase (adenine-specific)
MQQIPIFELTIPRFKSGQRLTNGDCLRELKKIPNNSIDFCFADPPYNLEKKYDDYNDSLELREYFAWCDKWLSELGRVLKPGRTVAVLNIPLWAIRHYQQLCKDLTFQSWIVWDAMGLPVRMIMPSHYSIICFSKGQSRLLPGLIGDRLAENELESLLPLKEFFCLRASCINARTKKKIDDREGLSDLWYDIHRLKHNTRRVEHPTQLPPMLMRRLFSVFTEESETILDCFNGSGTSTLVAQQMGRQFIGIEISERYHKLAEKRHHELSLGRDPFGKKVVIPKAKNSRVPRLPKQQYKVSKKALQLEVRRIAQMLNRLPTRDEVKAIGKYPIKYYDEYFISWGEVCAAARTTGMSEYPSEKSSTMVQPELFTD